MIHNCEAQLEYESHLRFEKDFFEYQNLPQFQYHFLVAEVLPDITILMETQHIDYFRLPAISSKNHRDILFYFKKLDKDLYEYLRFEVL